MKNIILSGSTGVKYAKRISELSGVDYKDSGVYRFKNGETCCDLDFQVKGNSFFVIQATRDNDDWMEVFLISDALRRAGAHRITAIIPFFHYSRQDRRSFRHAPISSKLMADFLQVAGVDEVYSVDFHAEQMEGFFNIPITNMLPINIIGSYIKENILGPNTMLVSPDAGAVKTTDKYASQLNLPYALVHKRRTKVNSVEATHIVGDVKGKDCVIIDDMCDTGGTLIATCELLKSKGAKTVTAIVTHPILSSGATELIKRSASLDRFVCSDTLPIDEAFASAHKVRVVSTAPMIASVLKLNFDLRKTTKIK